MHDKLESTLNRLPHIPRALRLVWRASGLWSIVWLLLLVLHGLIPAGIVYLSRILVDNLSIALAGGEWQEFTSLLQPALAMGLLMFLMLLIESGINWIHVLQAELVSDYLARLIHRKSSEVDMAFYETPDFHDHLHRARNDALYLPLDLLESIGDTLESVITLAAMSVLLIPYGLWLALSMVVSSAPALVSVLRNHAALHRWWESSTSEQRWAKYYDMILTDEESAAELRLFNLAPHFLERYQEVRADLRAGRLRIVRGQMMTQLAAGIFALFVSAAAAVIILLRTVQGWYTMGDLVLMYQAFNLGQGLLHALLGNVGQIYRQMLFLDNLFAFLDLAPQVTDPPNPRPLPERLEEGLRFRDVTFAYPGSQKTALEHFNFFIPAGKTVALVGENGAGKSTLVKLLCRFYDPQSGSIEFDGADLREFAQREVRDALAVMFQRPVPYHATAAENIAVGLGHLQGQPDEVEFAARAAGAHNIIMSLPRDYQTLLGKWFLDGAGLSEGEWQRIALARAFMRQTDIVILDEPTSAMDSWAEAEWLDRFSQLVAGRTALIITHRFTTAMRAEVIYVMKDGQIVEAGSHRDLLEQGSLYAESWQRQVEAATVKTPAEESITFWPNPEPV